MSDVSVTICGGCGAVSRETLNDEGGIATASYDFHKLDCPSFQFPVIWSQLPPVSGFPEQGDDE